MREGPCDISVHPACFGSSSGLQVHWQKGSAFSCSELCGMAVKRPQRVVQPWDTSQHSVVSPSLGASKLWQERAGAALPLDICAGGQTSSRALVVSWKRHWHKQERCLLTVDPTTFHPFCSRVDIDCSQSCFVPSRCPLERRCQNRALPTSWCPPSLDVSLVWSGLSKFL